MTLLIALMAIAGFDLHWVMYPTAFIAWLFSLAFKAQMARVNSGALQQLIDLHRKINEQQATDCDVERTLRQRQNIH